jgi:hypothetical protein
MLLSISIVHRRRVNRPVYERTISLQEYHEKRDQAAEDAA